LMNEGKYYQAGLLLKSAQDGIVVDSQSVQESPTHSVQHDAAH
ncbi:TPA_asm: YfdX family protein, partial [Salmonella enterica subsp. enterica serovar Enteritidis str. P125109]|nr:YfdX family protein [Salmonella enterica subsp. enterica serovar Enteritidis str. P125109]